MSAKSQTRLSFRSAPKTVLDRTSEHDGANLQLARDVLADADNPRYAHLLAWAERVDSRLEGNRGATLTGEAA